MSGLGHIYQGEEGEESGEYCCEHYSETTGSYLGVALLARYLMVGKYIKR